MTAHSQTAFVGLGAIGLPMAVSLARAGFTVTGVEPDQGGRDRAASVGIDAVADIADIGAASVVVIMVATPAQLTAVVDAAVRADIVGGRTWIVMSTVGRDAVSDVASRILEAGGQIVDAPVSGGVARAAHGDLVLFVSGDDPVVTSVTDVLHAMGTVRRVGEAVGDGQSIKVVNQHLCAVHIVAAAEALALAERLQLDPAFVLDVIGGGAASSFMLSDRGPRMIEGPAAEVRSQVGIFVKDTGLVSDAAATAGLDLPLLQAARARFLAAAELGLVTRDDSSVLQTYRSDEGER